MTDLNKLTIVEAQQGLRRKDFSSVELVTDCLEEIKKGDEKIHSYLEVFTEDALKQAQKADELLADHKKNLPALLGIPLAVKDNILIEGRKCTAGSKILENFVAPYDATVVTKLKNQGAILLGKTNLDEFAMGSSTENSAFGQTRNPRDPSRVPGGSSGGSAAAVAANFCLGALGSDTGGSIRQPAALCGVVGFKPTYGAVSRHGLIAMASSLDQIGPLTKTARDASILFSAISGGDDFDSTGAKSKTEIPTDEDFSLANIKIGVPRQYFARGLDAKVEKTIRSALDRLEKAGATLKEVDLPHTKYALPAYYIIVPAEVSANLARFDGIRYGHHSDQARDLLEVYNLSRAFGFGAEVKRRIILGTYILSAGYYDAYYLKAQKVRKLIKQDFARVLEEVDFIAGPTAPNPAWRFGEKTADPLQMYLEDIYTVSVNLAGLPAISLPGGLVEEDGQKLPIGIQFIGRRFDDGKLLSFASLVENLLVV